MTILESCESVKSLTFDFFCTTCSFVTCFSVSNFVFIFNISFDIHNNQYHCKSISLILVHQLKFTALSHKVAWVRNMKYWGTCNYF